MTDRRIRQLALVFVFALAITGTIVGVRYNSAPWLVLGGWLLLASFVELTR